MRKVGGLVCCVFPVVVATVAAGASPSPIAGMLDSFGAEEHRAAAGMVTVASCTGPFGPFTTEVISVRPDVTLFTQRSNRGARRLLVAGDRVWSLTEDGQPPSPVDPVVRAFVRGHEFHVTLLEVERRFSGFASGDSAPYGGEPCAQVTMVDEHHNPARLCLDREDGKPRGLTFTPPGEGTVEPIVIEYRDWVEDAGLTLFRAFDLRQGDERYSYSYSVVAPVTVSPEFFDPGADPAWLAARLEDLAAVMMSHQRLMEAHRRSDPGMCFGDDATDYLSINRGAVSRPAPEARRTRFFSYLEHTDYEIYRDVAPPEVAIARDGSLAWLACEMEADGIQRQEDGSSPPIRFNAAWVELMRSEGGRWLRIGDASNFQQ